MNNTEYKPLNFHEPVTWDMGRIDERVAYLDDTADIQEHIECRTTKKGG